MNTNFKRNLFIGFGISFLILIVSSVASLVSITNLLKSSRQVNHTQEVIYNLNEGTAVLVNAQNGMRGYLLTGDPEFLEQVTSANDNSAEFFDKVQRLTTDNPLQQKTFVELRPYRMEFIEYLKARIAERTGGKPTLAEDINKGKGLMSNMKSIIKRIENEEQRLLQERLAESERYGTYSVILIVAAALISLLISGVYFFRIFRDYNDRARLHNELKQKDEETAQRIRVISTIANEISGGNYDVRVDDSEKDALGSVSNSLNNMAASLSHSFNTLSEKEWLQAGIAGLSEVMIGEKTLEHLSRDIIEYITEYTSGNAGAMYIMEGNSLKISAGYSYVPDKSRERLRIGEGLTGQAAESRKIVELRVGNAEDIKVYFALGEARPAHVVAVPLMETDVEGVAELASVKEFTPLQMEFLKAVAGSVGIAIKAAQNRKRVQELLEETEAQSEELRVQHSELESINAELETQTEKLQASEEELRVQQEELQQTNEELAERSVLLEERNLEIQKKSEDLELTTRYKSEFLANMSHELRTPLNSILLLSRLLSENNDKNLNDEQVEFARVIQSSGNGLLGLIDEILDLSKIEAGKMELEFLDIATHEVTDTMKALFTEIAKQKGIEFNIEAEDAPVVLKTDKMRLEQIIKNLISNAVKFTSKGSVTLRIHRKDGDDKKVCFTVKDTGIGIPPEKQPLVFEAFQQADGSTKRKYGGTGLGLSISRELARLLRGEITLKSTVNEGSEFTLCIPIIGSPLPQPAEKQDIQVAAPVEIEQEGKENDGKEKYLSPSIPEEVPDDRDAISQGDKAILIVEDDINFAKSLLDFSRKRGYKGIVTVRGDHALSMALNYRPAGILLDIQLPVKSGWEVMEELKTNPKTRHIPVHIMSSHRLKQESLLKGAVNFLDKPVAFEQMPDIFKRIEHIINKESQKVLIMEDNPKHAKALAYFLETFNISSEIKSEIQEGVEALKKAEVDCVILDMGVPDKHAYEVLENIRKNQGLESTPVIVFTGKSLSMKEEVKIKKYADSIVVKTAHSYQRMLDEVSLFLHLMEEKKKENGRNSFKQLNQLNNILSDKTVLVVDDDVRNIYSLTKALESLRMNVITAIDGKEALKALEQHPKTDVVLLDMMMPNMDGYETATRIRQNSKWKNLPVIAVTAKAMTGDREKCINAGASDYITKPVDVDQLLSLLRVWLYESNS